MNRYSSWALGRRPPLAIVAVLFETFKLFPINTGGTLRSRGSIKRVNIGPKRLSTLADVHTHASYINNFYRESVLSCFGFNYLALSRIFHHDFPLGTRTSSNNKINYFCHATSSRNIRELRNDVASWEDRGASFERQYERLNFYGLQTTTLPSSYRAVMKRLKNSIWLNRCNLILSCARSTFQRWSTHIAASSFM
ncbi:hypothetical protein PUN28_000565 [Cardiocondyla obscurior]|uniref:Uncharacterized protein n=1 Tax=Cardiocondyla obscurior TaxID=286306 RepID=A0AAW2H0G4_9HYME